MGFGRLARRVDSLARVAAGANERAWTSSSSGGGFTARAASVNAPSEGWRGGRAPTPRGTPPLPPATRAPPDGRREGGGGGYVAVGGGGGRPAVGGIVPEDIDAVYHQMQHLGNKWADAHAEAEMLEEAKKCVLATITLHYIEDGNAKSAAEVQAYASQEYQDHIKKMVEARRRANLAKIELESIKTHLNLTRTYEATRREEMKLL